MADNLFETIIENVDIVDVVSARIPLIPKGKNLFGVCPFHNDSNPSMSVTREKGIFYCFTCHTGGNAIKFVSDYDKISYHEAAIKLAKEYHIDVSKFEDIKKEDPKKPLFETTESAKNFFRIFLKDDDEAMDYLYKRGITDEAIKDFDIGLSPKGNDDLSMVLEKNGIIRTRLMEVGLRNNKTDIYLDRIIVPIKDEYNRTIGFGGRIFREGNSDNKYINTGDTKLFHKSNVVFNIFNATRDRENNYLILNEGYMDVIQASSHGVKNSIALMGTAITDEQVDLIKKYTNNVRICLDGDKAGVNAVAEVIRKFEANNISYRVVILKNNLDPDEYIRTYGVDSYKNEIENNSLDKFGYYYKAILLKYGKVNDSNINSIINEMFMVIKEVPTRTEREIFLNRLSTDLNISNESLRNDFYTFAGIGFKNKKDTTKSDIKLVVSSREKCEKLLIDYSLYNRSYFETIDEYLGRMFMKNRLYRSLFIEIGDIYDSYKAILMDDLIAELKRRGVYQNYEMDPIIEYSLDDLYDNLIKGIEIEEKKERIDYIMNVEMKEVVKDPSLSEIEKSKKQEELMKEYMKLLKEVKRK